MTKELLVCNFKHWNNHEKRCLESYKTNQSVKLLQSKWLMI